MAGDYFKHYNGANRQQNKKRTLSPLQELKNHTEQTRKSYFLDYILEALNHDIYPQQGVAETADGKMVYYVICPLPYDCLAVYTAGKVYIAEGRHGDGSLKLMPRVVYDEKAGNWLSADRLGVGIGEEEFVRKIRQLVELFFPHEVK